MRVAACQTPDVVGDVDRAVALIRDGGNEAARRGAALVCFPEAFLQGYVVDPQHVADHALSLCSSSAGEVFAALAEVQPVLVFGLLERQGDRFFNTAVLLHRGQLLGRYRKRNLIGSENDVFTAGGDTPVFDVDGQCIGINICYDMQFPEAGCVLSAKGARLLVCPANNMLSRANAEAWKHRHNEIRREHARRAGAWLLSADVCGTRGDKISYGPTALIDPAGHVVDQLPLMRPDMLVAEIPER